MSDSHESQPTLEIPHFSFKGFDIAKLYEPITDINLVVHLYAQGICDERHDLRIVPRQPNRQNLMANHFSVWVGFGWNESVMIDIVQAGTRLRDPIFDKVETEHLHGVVRITCKPIPTEQPEDDVGTVLRALDVKPGTTMQHIIDVIRARGRQLYKFMPMYKQQVGCRYWLYIFCWDLEQATIVGPGFASDVYRCLLTFYYRHLFKKHDRGRWIKAGNWSAETRFRWKYLPTGNFYRSVTAPSRN